MSRRGRARGVDSSSLSGSAADVNALLAGELDEPHRLLGAHPLEPGGRPGWLVRAHHPEAKAAWCLLAGGRAAVAMSEVAAGGLFACLVPESDGPPVYRLRFRARSGVEWEQEDAYRFPACVGELDLHLFAEGRHRRLWEVMGANPRCSEGVPGVAFAVWAPHARRVSVVGDFCAWDGRLYPMRRRGGVGLFELFVPGVRTGDRYKFEILTRSGDLRIKTDPFARVIEPPPECASRVSESGFRWSDREWLADRGRHDPLRSPLSIYEVHLGSWRRGEGGRLLGYRELAPLLVEHARRFGFTHLELMPVAEHPFDGSWGYQVSGYYAATGRFGSPDDLRALIDTCHRAGLGVILDWVPAHFPRDDFALRRFDGEPLYEYADPRLGEHPDWGTLVFDYGRPEVRGFLIANALYWMQEFHVDGLRVDAVASMLYRDYGRRQGEWLPNAHGGRENLEAVAFLQELSRAVREACPGCITIAEESTAWPGVTRSPDEGGLGFHFKWNMGWMHDTLRYLSRDPLFRPYHQDEITFAALYESSERFIMPLSHDEVVHEKRSLYGKMPGDRWQKLANLRLLTGYQTTRPGKQLTFMGSELAPEGEWDYRESLPWHLEHEPDRAGLARWLEALGRVYLARPSLWRCDPDPEGFVWIDCSDRRNSVVCYRRRDLGDAPGGGDVELVVVLHCGSLVRDHYRIGAPQAGRYRVLLCSDDVEFGGSGALWERELESDPTPCHGLPQSLVLRLPPLACLVLEPLRA